MNDLNDSFISLTNQIVSVKKQMKALDQDSATYIGDRAQLEAKLNSLLNLREGINNKTADAQKKQIDANDKLLKQLSFFKDEADKNADANQKNAQKSSAAFNQFKKNINSTGGAVKKVTASMSELGNKVSDVVGGQLTDLFGALQQLSQAQTDARLNDLEMQLQAELEAAGVAEQTAVQKAQQELAIAKQEGDQELIQEKQKLLKKAQIEEEYAKKMRKVEYDGALASWGFQKAIAIVEAARAPLAAYVATLPVLGPIGAGAAAAAAAVTAGIQLAAVEASKPQKPKFEQGGIVPGGNAQMVGDPVDIRANAGEAVITQNQQARLLELADGAQSNTVSVRVVGGVTFDKFLDEMFRASAEGRLLIADTAITSRY